MSAPNIDGRLGLAESRIPYVDRHGLIFLSRGRLYVEDGTLRFECAASGDLDAGNYAIPYQSISMICLGPGSSLTHDALRITALHGTSIVATGDGGVKFYSAPPIGRAKSFVARRHAELWADKKGRIDIARKMYALRFGKILPHKDIEVLRGIEGGRVKESYKILATKHGIVWKGRVYDRNNPEDADIPNQAINHASTFVESAAEIAVSATGALHALGFIHEDASTAFVLDIADLFRESITIPIAFASASKAGVTNLEREIRYFTASEFRRKKVIPSMIDAINKLIGLNNDDNNKKG